MTRLRLSLTSLTVPESVQRIGEKAFARCPSLTLVVREGSFAAEYARQNGIPYRIAH